MLPGGLVNYLATLGWSPDEGSEVLSLTELIEMFQLDNVVSAGANFDLEKLKWFNHKHLQKTKNDYLVEELQSLNVSARKVNKVRLAEAIGLVKERANTVSELWSLVKYLFFEPKYYDKKSLKKIKKDGLDKICSEIISLCHNTKTPNELIENLKLWGGENGIGVGQIMMTTRTILVGGLSGIDLQKIVSFIGLDSVCRRAEVFAKKHI